MRAGCEEFKMWGTLSRLGVSSSSFGKHAELHVHPTVYWFRCSMNQLAETIYQQAINKKGTLELLMDLICRNWRCRWRKHSFFPLYWKLAVLTAVLLRTLVNLVLFIVLFCWLSPSSPMPLFCKAHRSKVSKRESIKNQINKENWSCHWYQQSSCCNASRCGCQSNHSQSTQMEHSKTWNRCDTAAPVTLD